MPAVGLEYRYPFINVQPWGTTIEPIAQIIARPNETYAGKLPNEDAQSAVFDASNLFAVDKFSGYDRVGGGRAMSASRRPRSSIAAAASMCCSTILPAVRPEFVCGEVRLTPASVRPAELPVRLRRPRQLFAEPNLYVQRALARG